MRAKGDVPTTIFCLCVRNCQLLCTAAKSFSTRIRHWFSNCDISTGKSPSTAPDDARAVTSSDPLAPAQRDAYTAMQGQKKLVRAREGGRGERKSSGYHAVDQLDVGLSCETDRERERIRTVRRRVYVPSIGHLFPPFLYDRRRSEGLTARRCCAKTKPRAAARRFTAEEREREREKEREQIERQFEQ